MYREIMPRRTGRSAELAEITPMLQQYLRVKEEYPQTLVFFRLGDFYELFNDDALIASRELEIVLTGREAGKDVRMPMCGVPYHAADRKSVV